MKTFIRAGLVAALFSTAVAFASPAPSVSGLQKEVDKAQVNLDAAKEKAEPGMAASGKTEWMQAEAKFESMVAAGKDSKQIAAQKDLLKELDARVLQSSDRGDIESARSKLAVAQSRLNVAKSRLRNGPDDSSQAIQQENRTQNGSGFSIRSERDSENHPPLPASK